MPPIRQLLGRSNLSKIANQPYPDEHDDVYGQVLPANAGQPPFTLSYLGVPYSFTDVYWSSNTYLTFGNGSDEFLRLDLTNPAFPSWLLGAADTSVEAVFAGMEVWEGEAVVRMRYEGYGSNAGFISAGEPDVVYEITFYAGQRASIVVGEHVRAHGGFWGMSDGQGRLVVDIPACKWCSISLCSDVHGNGWAVLEPVAFSPPAAPPFASAACLQPPPPRLGLLGSVNLSNILSGSAGALTYGWLLPPGAAELTFTYLGVLYGFADMYWSSHMYLTFGRSDDYCCEMSMWSPEFPTWLLGAGPGRVRAVYIGQQVLFGERAVRFRYEGDTGSDAPVPTVVYEITFFAGNRVHIAVGQHSNSQGGFWGMSDGQGRLVAAIPACQWCSITLCGDAQGNNWAVSVQAMPSPPPIPPSAPPSPPSPPSPPPVSAADFCKMVASSPAWDLDSDRVRCALQFGGDLWTDAAGTTWRRRTLLLADMLPGAVLVQWPASVEISSDGVHPVWVVIDGQLPNTTQPHRHSREWRGTRQRMIVNCSDAGTGVPQTPAIVTRDNVTIHIRNVQWQYCTSGVLQVAGAPAASAISALQVSLENCAYITAAPLVMDRTASQSATSSAGYGIYIAYCWVLGEYSREPHIDDLNPGSGVGNFSDWEIFPNLQGGSQAFPNLQIGSDDERVPFGVNLTIAWSRFENLQGLGAVVLASDTPAASYLHVHGCKFVNNDVHVTSLAVYSAQLQLSVTNSSFLGNSGVEAGALAQIGQASTAITSTMFLNNKAYQSGAVRLTEGLATITQCVFSNNLLAGDWYANGAKFCGALCSNSSTEIYVYNSSFTNNQAGFGAGALQQDGGGVVMRGCTFRENSGGAEGGAVRVSITANFGLFSVTDSIFIDNVASGNGGAVSLNIQAVINANITGSTFKGNRALQGNGGALFGSPSSTLIAIRGCAFAQNHAKFVGGAVVGNILNMSDTVFDRNQADVAGGAVVVQVALLPAPNVVFTRNSASYGGAISSADNVKISLGAGCSLQGNSATRSGGAVSVGRLASLHLSGVEFLGNTAELGGGMLLLGENDVRVESSLFTGNRASRSGGVLHGTFTTLFVMDSVFSDNCAQEDGGVFYATGNTSLLLSGTALHGNCALGPSGRGGVMFLDASTANLQHCNASGNNATDGGAIVLRNQPASLTVTGGSLAGNIASGAGGAVNLGSGCTAVLANVSLVGNMAGKGGAVLCEGAATLRMGCDLSHNTATQGGAVCVLAEGFLAATNSTLAGNTATGGDGGAVLVELGGDAVVADSMLEGNNASMSGGAIWTAGHLTLRDCELLGNDAGMDGGGVCCMSCNDMVVAGDCVLEGNTASGGGGGLYLHPAAGNGTTAADASVSRRLLDAAPLYIVNITGADVRLNAAARGGGVMLNTSDCGPLPPPYNCVLLSALVLAYNDAGFASGHHGSSLAGLMLDDVTIVGGGGLYAQLGGGVVIEASHLNGNTAVLGGGALIDTRQCNSSCLTLANVSVSGNRAVTLLEGGRAEAAYGQELFLSSPLGMTVRCGGGSSIALVQLIDAGMSEEALGCASASSLIAALGGSGSGPFRLQQVGSSAVMVASREMFSLEVEVVDMFGRRMQLATPQPLLISVRLLGQQPEATLAGTTIVQSQSVNESLLLQGLRLQATAGSYAVGVQAQGGVVVNPAMTVVVTVRRCVVGEEQDQDVCRNCGDAQYNFDPQNTTCRNCEDHSLCRNGLLFPDAGYWHSHPRSPQMHRCPIRDACAWGGNRSRLQVLQDLQQGALHAGADVVIDRGVLMQYEERQCNTAAGYGGPLCSICRDGYGSAGARCRRCLPRGAASVIVAIAVIVQASIICGQVLLFLIDHRKRQMAQAVLAPHSRLIDLEKSEPVQVVVQPGGSRSAAVSPMQHAAAQHGAAQHAPPTESHLTVAAGVFKLLLQYVQLLGTMQGIGLDLPNSVLVILESIDIPSAVDSLPLYCSLTGSSWARTIKYLLISVLIPLLVAVVVVAAAYVPSLWMLSSSEGYLQRARHVALVSVLTTGVFFYPAVTKQLLRTLNFVTLDTDTNVPGAVTAMQGLYWQAYPSQRFGRGSHLVLMLAVGIPGLVLFSIGFPILLVALLLPLRKRLQELEVQRWFGLLYEDYHPTAFYWQAVVLLAQLLLTICSVLLSELGAQVQLLTAVVIVLLYSYLHGVVQPFALSVLVPLSHLTNSVLMLSMLLLLYITSTGGARYKTAIGGVFVASNCVLIAGLLAVMVHYLVQASRQHRWMDRASVLLSLLGTRLNSADPDDDPSLIHTTQWPAAGRPDSAGRDHLSVDPVISTAQWNFGDTDDLQHDGAQHDGSQHDGAQHDGGSTRARRNWMAQVPEGQECEPSQPDHVQHVQHTPTYVIHGKQVSADEMQALAMARQGEANDQQTRQSWDAGVGDVHSTEAPYVTVVTSMRPTVQDARLG